MKFSGFDSTAHVSNIAVEADEIFEEFRTFIVVQPGEASLFQKDEYSDFLLSPPVITAHAFDFYEKHCTF